MIRLHLFAALVLVLPGIFITPDLHSQTIVHIENRRVAGMKEGLSGTIDLQANYIQNKNNIFQTFNSLQTQYQSGVHSVLFVGSYNFGMVSKNRVINDSYQHLRYTRLLIPRFAFEFFLQSQHNEGIQLRWRGLAGAGPRFELFRTEHNRLFLGTLYMYEYEQERESEIIYREHRLSNYVSFGMLFTDIVSADMILYYQPNVQNWSSYKYSSQASLEVRLSDRFALVTAFSMTYNTRPPEGIQRTYISFKNGIRFDF